MKKKLPSFIAGMLTTALIAGLSISALAASGAVSFNRSPIQFNGQQISAAGEDYALDNGCMAPSSITYTDEKGGGTTYLPARRIAELMGVGIGYDASTGAVTVSGEATPAPTTTASAADYSDWTAEEEAAYQEFKGMWDIKGEDSINPSLMTLELSCKPDSVSPLRNMVQSNTEELIGEFGIKYMDEYRSIYPNLLAGSMTYWINGVGSEVIMSVTCSYRSETHCTYSKEDALKVLAAG